MTKKRAQDYKHIRDPLMYDEAHYNDCGCITSIIKDGVSSFGHCDIHRSSYTMGQSISRTGYLKIPTCSICRSVHRDHEDHTAEGFLFRALDTILSLGDLTQLEAFYEEITQARKFIQESIKSHNRANIKRQKEANKQ